MKKIVCLNIFLCITSYAWSNEFTVARFNEMVNYIGESMRDLPYSFQGFDEGGRDVAYRNIEKAVF